jgi:cytochrome P450
VIDYDPFSPEVMRDPWPVYAELRAAGAAHRLARYDAWALPRFDDVWQVLADRERFTIAEGPIFPRERLEHPNDGAPDTTAGRPLRSFSTIDPPEHTRLRRAMLPPFLPRAVAGLEDRVRQRTRSRLDALAGRASFDVVADLFAPVVAETTCELLGLSTADHEWILERVNTSTRRAPGRAGVTDEGRAAQAELHAHLRAHVAASRGAGGLVDLLAAHHVAGDPVAAPLDDHEIAVQLGTLLVGGVETLPKIVAGGVRRLEREPALRDAIAADPAVAANAFEECMRLDAPLQWVGRTLLVDAEIAGVPMRAGERVLALLASANRDEREFPEPDRFMVDRPFRRTLVFGHGVHVCIGAHAARLEGRILLAELLARVPRYEVDHDGAERPASEFQVGWTRVPVRVAAGG